MTVKSPAQESEEECESARGNINVTFRRQSDVNVS